MRGRLARPGSPYFCERQTGDFITVQPSALSNGSREIVELYGPPVRPDNPQVVMLWAGLVLALLSAVAINWAYTIEHDAAVELPPLSVKHPVATARVLVSSRPWLVGLSLETLGWIVYLLALRLAPLSLVQAIGASGIAVLALIQTRGHPGRLSRERQWAVVLAVVGLLLLALSLIGPHPVDHAPAGAAAALWLGACFGAAAGVSFVRIRGKGAATLGLAAGLLFAGGDISARLVVFAGPWLLAVVPLIAAYALGSIELQSAFQRGDALTAAGIATLATNAVPIAAGVVLFDETLPGGVYRILQLAAFTAVVASAVMLTGSRARSQQQSSQAGSP